MKKGTYLYSFKVRTELLTCAGRTVGYAGNLPHNKRMQTDFFARYASKKAADAKRYVARGNRWNI